MAAGAAPAPQKNMENNNEVAHAAESQPLTLRQRIVHRLHEIFKGPEEYLGWRQ
jgi:hypothetical protein